MVFFSCMISRMYHRTAMIALAALFILAPMIALGSTSINEQFGKLEQQYQLPTGILAKIAMVESGGNPNLGSRSSSALGMFQWLTDSWKQASHALFGTVIDPSRRTDPALSAHVTAFALAQSKAKLGSLITQAKVDMTVGLYMGHFLGQGGASQFFSAYQQNPGAIGATLFSKAASANRNVFYNGGQARSLSEIVNFFAKKLGSAGVPNIAGDFTNSMPSASDFLQGVLPPKTDSERDFQTNYSTGRPPAAPNPLNSATMPSPSAQQSKNQPGTQAGSSGTEGSGTSSSVPSESLIIAQSSRIPRGGKTLISWVSVGMVPDSCSVSLNDAPFASGNRGSKALPPGSTQNSGTLSFTLSCTSPTGTSEKEVRVVVQ